MRVYLQSKWLPKAGNSLDEYEDAFAPSRAGDYGGTRLAFAVADGASEGMLSGQWAQILAKTYCREAGSNEMERLLARAHQSWATWRSHYLARRNRENRPLQWFEEPGFERGAFSTLLGLSLSGGPSAGQWESLALGDSCLFHVREDRLEGCFPIDDASAFGSRPFLLASNPRLNTGMESHISAAKGKWRAGDRFYLMTDALAHWFVRECDAGSFPWKTLRQAKAGRSDSFEDWIAALRTDKRIRNDDVTLLTVEID